MNDLIRLRQREARLRIQEVTDYPGARLLPQGRIREGALSFGHIQEVDMSDTPANELRFKRLFTWGGVIIALLGLVFVVTGDVYMGILLVVAGMISWLFAKRRTRRSGV